MRTNPLCGLFMVRVKVVRHIEGEFRCGKENAVRRREV
jgi:hypothetical protein